MIIEKNISINIEGKNIKIKEYNLAFFYCILHILKANKFKKLYKILLFPYYTYYFINTITLFMEEFL